MTVAILVILAFVAVTAGVMGVFMLVTNRSEAAREKALENRLNEVGNVGAAIEPGEGSMVREQSEGLLPQGDSPGGGRLVYLGRNGAAGPTQRAQDALTADVRGDWRELVQNAAAATQGPQFPARINDGCAHGPVRPNCPAQAVADGTAQS